MNSQLGELARVYPDNLGSLFPQEQLEVNRPASLITQMRLPLPAGESNRREEAVREKLFQSYPRNAGLRIMNEEWGRLHDLEEGAETNHEAFDNFVIDTHLTRSDISEAARNEIMATSTMKDRVRLRRQIVNELVDPDPDAADYDEREDRRRMQHIERNYPDYEDQIMNFQNNAKGFRTALREDIIKAIAPADAVESADTTIRELRRMAMIEGASRLLDDLRDVQWLYLEYQDRKKTEPKTDPILVSFRKKLLKIQKGLTNQDYLREHDTDARAVKRMLRSLVAPKVTANRTIREKFISGL